MKIVTVKKMLEIEKIVGKDGLFITDLMDNAAWGISQFLAHYIRFNELSKKVIVFCGKGHNAADALSAGILLLQKKFEIKVYSLFDIKDCSKICREKILKLSELGGDVSSVIDLKDVVISDNAVILDGIFGTGFKGEVSDYISEVIKKINDSNNHVVSVDIPSGLNGDKGVVSDRVICADHTLFLGFPKLGFFINDGWNYVGTPHFIDLGIDKRFYQEIDSNMEILVDIKRSDLPYAKRTSNKYQRGFLSVIAGSKGMCGAAKLSSLAALRSGSGIVKLFIPEGLSNEMASLADEVVRCEYNCKDHEDVLRNINKSSAVFIGPGISCAPEVEAFIKSIISSIKVPLVLDADGLNIISNNLDIIIPENSILTPHRKEMMRLLNLDNIDDDEMKFLEQCQDFSNKRNVIVILKGAPTFIFKPHGAIKVNLHGDPGMATAGSGDVLTGIVGALLSQGVDNYQAACMGVLLHSYAGELAAQDKSSFSMIASDIINNLPQVFKDLDINP